MSSKAATAPFSEVEIEIACKADPARFLGFPHVDVACDLLDLDSVSTEVLAAALARRGYWISNQ